MERVNAELLPSYIRRFLRQVDREILPLGVHEYLQVVRTLKSLPTEDHRAALAGLLSTNAEQWDRIIACYDSWVPRPPVATPGRARVVLDAAKPLVVMPIETSPVSKEAVETSRSSDSPPLIDSMALEELAEESEAAVAPPDRSSPQAWLVKVVQAIARLPRWTRILLPLSLFVSLGAFVAWQHHATSPTKIPLMQSPRLAEPEAVTAPPPLAAKSEALPTQTQSGDRATTPRPASQETDPVRLPQPSSSRAPERPTAMEPSLEVRTTGHQQPYASSPTGALHPRFLIWLALLCLLVGLPLGAIALRLWWLPTQVRISSAEEVERQKVHALALRSRLSATPRGPALRPVYLVPTELPLARSTLEDCANLLGRIYRLERSLDLDADATLRATMDAGGELRPVFSPRRVTRELLVLLDYEADGHPLLLPFLRVLDYWERIGVSIIRMRFDRWPGALFPAKQMRPLSLKDVARTHEGAALIIFSRHLSLRQLDGRSRLDWIDEVRTWSLRAWLDGDPRTAAERSRAERHQLEALERAGLERFPFTADGVLALARYFAAEGIGVTVPPEPPLPRLSDARTCHAIEQWAAAAALVPDADWDQLERFRRKIRGIEAALPDHRCVHLLIAYLANRTREDVAAGGNGLVIPVEEEDALVGLLRAAHPLSPRSGYQLGPLESAIRVELLTQLGETAPEPRHSLAWWFWRMRTAMHRAPLHPDDMLKEYLPLLGSPVDPEARGAIEREIRRRPGAVPLLERWLGLNQSVILLHEFWRGHRGLWWRGTGFAIMAMALLSVAICLFAWGLPRLRRAGQSQAYLPSIFEVVLPAPYRIEGTAARPTLVVLSPWYGGEDSERPQLPLGTKLIRRDALASTEVTRAQFTRVMEQRAPRSSEAELPQTDVTWLEAWEYCRRLSISEGLSPCPVPSLSSAPSATSSAAGCTGYRLPTQIEWQHAWFAPGPPLADLKKSDAGAWNAENSGSTLHRVGQRGPSRWGLFDLLGNAAEWTSSLGRDAEQSYPLVVGGSFQTSSRNMGIESATPTRPQERSHAIGFRVIRVLKE